MTVCREFPHPFLNFIFLLLTLLQMSPPLLLCSPHPDSTPLPSGHHHTVVCVYGLCTYVLWLIPSPSFVQSPIPSDSCQSVPCVHVSVSILSVSLFGFQMFFYFPFDFFLGHWLFWSTLLNVHIFVNFPVFFLLLTSSFIP